MTDEYETLFCGLLLVIVNEMIRVKGYPLALSPVNHILTSVS